MSQQEFIPESRHQHGATQNSEEASTAQQYNRRRQSDMPKQDHPSSYDDTVPPYGYQAQDKAKSTQQQAQEPRFREGSQQQWQWQYVPPWARPQQHTGNPTRWIKILLITLLILVAIPLLIKLLLILFAVFAFIVFTFFVFIALLVVGFLFTMTQGHRHRW
jgi:hypothetical protein